LPGAFQSATTMPQGFGKPQPTKTNKLVEQVLQHSRDRNPEALDQILDNSPVELNRKLVDATVTALHQDIDTLAWFCGYFAGAINRSEDNNKPSSIVLLSKLLIKSGMQPFVDFAPYPGCRLMVVNTDKFAALPEKVQILVQEAFDVVERTPKEAQRINNALIEELMVMG
jgi:hypothetical protein